MSSSGVTCCMPSTGQVLGPHMRFMTSGRFSVIVGNIFGTTTSTEYCTEYRGSISVCQILIGIFIGFFIIFNFWI